MLWISKRLYWFDMAVQSLRSRKRAKPGTVNLKVARNSIQLVFTHEGKRHYIAPGLSADSPWDLKQAQDLAFQLQKDLEYGEFDASYAKYKVQPEPAQEAEDPTTELIQLWQSYQEVKSPGKSPSTLREYDWVANHIKRCPYSDLEAEAQAMIDWFENHVPAKSRKKLFQKLTSCCEWSQKSGQLDANPFVGLASQVRIKKTGSDEDEVYPFSRSERSQVIAAFKSHYYYRHYAPLVEFLFLTGCRPSEMVALQWKHILPQEILFEQAFVDGGRRGIVLKYSLKTQLRRKFPINDQLRQLLDSHKPDDCSSSDYVFPARRGNRLNWGNFNTRAWKHTLASLPDIEYRNPYQTRHTFCSLCREAGISSIQIAKWVGNSAAMIDRIYAKAVETIQVPDF